MSWIASVFNMTCPRCRKGKMFEFPLNFRKPLKMHKHCSVCSLRMEPETGFYYGAMFISYVFMAFLCLSIVGISVFIFDVSVELSFAGLILFLMCIFHWNLRFSRSIWIHLVIKYDPRFKNEPVKQEEL